MNKFACCAFLIALGVGLRAELTVKQNYLQKSTRHKILGNEEELKDDYEALLLEFVRNHSYSYKINVVLSSSDCSICSRILGVLMKPSTQSFFTINDIALTNYSVINETAGLVPHVGYYKSVIFLTENVHEFFEHFSKLQLRHAWNPRAEHLIFTVKKPDDKELDMIFEKCWSARVINVAVIIYNRKEAFTYNPYLKNHREMREQVEWSRLFYDKLRNMNGHVIRIKYIPFSSNNVVKWIKEEGRFKIFGSDFGYGEAFFKSVNATPRYINLTNDMVLLYENFTYRHETWKNRKFRGAEVWLNAVLTEIKFHERCEKNYPVAIDNLQILAPKSGPKAPSILEPYNNIAWTCVLLSLITFALYSHAYYKRRGIVDNAFLRTLGVFLGKNLANRRHGFLEKCTFLIFTMYSLLVLSAYQGALYGALATVSHYPEINTLSELYQRVKTIHTYHSTSEYLRNYVEPGVTVLAFGAQDFRELMKINRDEAYAFSSTFAEYTVKSKALSENGVPFYHLVNEYAVGGFVCHTVPYGSPYLEKLDRILLICKQAGLDLYWEREANLHAVLSGIIIPDVVQERTLKKLSLQTQLTTFYIWGIGLLTSFFCWTAEIYLYKKSMIISVNQRLANVAN